MKSSTENIYKQKVNQVIDYINFNLHQPLQLNVIADIVNMSQRQLLRMMSSALDEPLYSYVARQRVERAVLYMQTEDMSLQNLAGSLATIIRNRSPKHLRNNLVSLPKHISAD